MDPNDQNPQAPTDDDGQTPVAGGGDTPTTGDIDAPMGDTPVSTPPPAGDIGGGEPEIAPPTPEVPEVGTGGGGADSSGQPA